MEIRGISPERKGVEREGITQKHVEEPKVLQRTLNSSVKGKLAARRGRKADGSLGDGRAAGENPQEERK
jgi:hypothetical protein